MSARPARAPLPPRAGTRPVVPADGGIYGYERALRKAGFTAIAGADEAGRGACAGPLVVAAAILADGGAGRIPDLNDSKLLTPEIRARVFDEIRARARAWAAVVIPSAEVDSLGLHRANLEGMRRALARLDPAADYALTDGFPVPGIGAPSLAVWKGDQVSGSIAAAGVLAKVTRDRLMAELHRTWPEYGFDEHKGYVTPAHRAALTEYGPCPEHRQCFAPVRAAKAAAESGDFDEATEGAA